MCVYCVCTVWTYESMNVWMHACMYVSYAFYVSYVSYVSYVFYASNVSSLMYLMYLLYCILYTCMCVCACVRFVWYVFICRVLWNVVKVVGIHSIIALCQVLWASPRLTLHTARCKLLARARKQWLERLLFAHSAAERCSSLQCMLNCDKCWPLSLSIATAEQL